MGNIHLVTGYAGKEHVSSADMASLHAMIFGSDQVVLNRGKNFSASVVTNNQVRVLDGDILMKGRHIRMNPGGYVDLAIENGTQGYMRNDLIVARYTRDSVTSVEDCNLVVIRGTDVTSNPVDPAYTSGDITFGGALENDMPLYRVPLNGLNVGELVPLFTVVDAINPKVLDHIGNKDNPHIVTKEQVGLGNVPNVSTNNQTPTYTAASALEAPVSGEKLSVAFGKIARFFSAFMSHASRHKKGGEDALSAVDIDAVPSARKVNEKPLSSDIELGIADVGKFSEPDDYAELGIARIVSGTYVGTGTYGQTKPNSITFPFSPKLFWLRGKVRYGNNVITTGLLEKLYWDTSYSVGSNSGIGGSTGVFSMTGNTVSWYTTNTSSGTSEDGVKVTPYGQMNGPGETYTYIAIG